MKNNYDMQGRYDINKFKYKFKNIEKIPYTLGHAFQDLFVLFILNGKTEGTYVEVGSYQPIEHSNTYLMETIFNWKGVSYELNKNWVDNFNSVRKNKTLYADGTTFDYLNHFKEFNLPQQIDYLSLDIDPPKNTLLALKKLPLDQYRFSCISFEHDAYVGKEGEDVRKESRQIFLDNGYQLLVPNVTNADKIIFEDWYIDPSVIKDINIENYSNFNCTEDLFFFK
jgi:hypothetical protein